ncbi:MAG: hypothetical protein SFV32_14645 [Opitutaceae bacterium]|nr:hypothetical protein [Opitutaceae bacterium]
MAELSARLAAFSAEQEVIRLERPAPPPLESVVPHGTNLLRLRPPSSRLSANARGAAAELPSSDSPQDVVTSDASPDYDAEEAPWPVDEGSTPLDDGEAPLQIVNQAPVAEARREPAAGKLPSLEELKAKLGAGEVQLLEELFRARYVSVKRVQAGWLKA